MVPASNRNFGQKREVFTGQKKELWVINTVFCAQVYTYTYTRIFILWIVFWASVIVWQSQLRFISAWEETICTLYVFPVAVPVNMQDYSAFLLPLFGFYQAEQQLCSAAILRVK